MPRHLLPFCLLALVSCGEKETVAPDAADDSDLSSAVASLEAEAFSDEQEARRFENEGIVPFWDRLLQASATERLDLLAAVPFETLTLGTASAPQEGDLGITLRKISKGGDTINQTKWQALIAQYKGAGYSLPHSDWHHSAFHRDEDGTAVSEVTFTLQGLRSKGEILDRLQFKGTLRIQWDESGKALQPKSITVLNASTVQRRGPVAFKTRAVIEGQTSKPTERGDMGAINVYDLNGDQLPEIILGNANQPPFPRPPVRPHGCFRSHPPKANS